VKAAEEAEFHEYVAARMDRWRRTAFLMCQSWHTADDVVSITVGKLYEHWRRARQADNLDAYVQRILTRSWLNERRRPWRRERSVAQAPDLVTEPEAIVDREGLADLLRSLGPRQRAVVVLRFYLDYSVEETASILGVSTGTVKSQSARGLATLRPQAESFR
jgi:RNA polymerase sigma-70 factor (sigma-E family)